MCVYICVYIYFAAKFIAEMYTLCIFIFCTAYFVPLEYI